MKASYYNITIPMDQDRIAIFNSISKKFFISSHDKKEIYLDIISKSDLYVNNPALKDFISKLCSSGFIVDDKSEEYKSIESWYTGFVNGDNYCLQILTTYACNFSCWYCVQNHKNEYLSDNVTEKIKKHIEEYLIQYNIKSFQLSWFGGEPLLNFEKINEISSFAKKFCKNNSIMFNCAITTNGSLLTKSMIAQMKSLDFESFQITVDGSKVSHNKTKHNKLITNSFDLILRNLVLVAEIIPNADIILRVNYTADNLSESFVDEIDSILKSVKSTIKILFRKVWQEQDDGEMRQRNLNIYKRLISMGYHIVHDYDDHNMLLCNVSQRHYHSIFPNGTVDYCSNRNYDETRGILDHNGHIVWKNKPISKDVNIFSVESECQKCKYLPICFGACPKTIENVLNTSEIKCHIPNKDEYFESDIKEYCQIKTECYQ